MEGPTVNDIEQVFLSSLDESGHLPSYRFASRYKQGTETSGIMQRMSEAKENIIDEWRQAEVTNGWANTNTDSARPFAKHAT